MVRKSGVIFTLGVDFCFCSKFSDDSISTGDLYIRAVSFSPNGKYMAAGAEDKIIKLYDLESNRVKHTYVGHSLDIYSLDYSNDGSLIVSGSGDRSVRIWDTQSEQVTIFSFMVNQIPSQVLLTDPLFPRLL
tara:strand:+ start:807 stop:1202 length:396 start_codon:yes stop_codon:yes gene_type:complete